MSASRDCAADGADGPNVLHPRLEACTCRIFQGHCRCGTCQLQADVKNDGFQGSNVTQHVCIVLAHSLMLLAVFAGISKQAQLLRRTPRDVATELLTESTDGAGPNVAVCSCGLGLDRGTRIPFCIAAPTTWEILRNVVNKPEPCIDELDEARTCTL